MRIVIALTLTCSIAGTLHAQDYDLRSAGLPRNVATHIRSVLDDAATKRFTGTASIAGGEVIERAVVVTDGVLTIAGTIRGELIALHADIVFESGAVVEGDITVVDGAIRNEEAARLTGTVNVYGEGFGLVGRAERFHDAPHWRRDRRTWRFGDGGGADLRVHVAENYNRVEGLPIQIGPEVRTPGRNALRLQALAIWRTDVGPITETQRMGYIARAEQFFGGGSFRVGASLRSTVIPLDAWGLTNLEASLATAVLGEDQRDYYEREGWSAYVRVAPRHSPLDVTVEYRDEEHSSLAPREPWTLFDRRLISRAQPLVAEGNVRAVHGAVEWDRRRGEEFNTRGYLLRAELTRGIDGSLRVPIAPPETTNPDMPADFSGTFTSAFVDLRGYQRAGRGGVLAVRGIAGGALTDRALPAQFQHALGGPGSLPGYTLLSGDCGARRTLVRRGDDASPEPTAFFPSYGCDRFALAQIEYRGGFGFRFGHSRNEHEHNWAIDGDFDWTFFFDAGRGWALEPNGFAGRSDTQTLYDVGAGVILGGLGIYGAVPLGDVDRGLRVIVRLGPRF